MDKQQTITFIESQLASGAITKDDLKVLASSPVTKNETSRNLTQVLYVIGAVIALIGIIILVAQNWREIGFMGRIAVTLGISLATYIAGLLFGAPEQSRLSQVMFTISAALAPLGAYVLLDEAGVRFTSGVQIAVAAILTCLFAAAFWISRKNILTLLTLFFGTWMYYAIAVKLFGSSYRYDVDYLKWATMILGVSYLLIGYGNYGSIGVRKILYAFGTLALLGAGIAVGGAFDLVFILMIFAAFYGSVYLKSQEMLVLAGLFLMAHIVKLTSKYFVDSIGWPIALIIVGFLVIGIGYSMVYLSRNFISKPHE